MLIDHTVMKQVVQECCDNDRIMKLFGLVGEGFVGRDNGAGLLILIGNIQPLFCLDKGETLKAYQAHFENSRGDLYPVCICVRQIRDYMELAIKMGMDWCE